MSKGQNRKTGKGKKNGEREKEPLIIKARKFGAKINFTRFYLPVIIPGSRPFSWLYFGLVK
jgi:hypothetical protein